jgi:hypothetical protein
MQCVLENEAPIALHDVLSVEGHNIILQDILDLLGTLRSGDHPYLDMLKALIG